MGECGRQGHREVQSVMDLSITMQNKDLFGSPVLLVSFCQQ